MTLNVETPLQNWDFLVIGLYFASMLLTGLFMAKFVKSSGDFFSGVDLRGPQRYSEPIQSQSRRICDG